MASTGVPASISIHPLSVSFEFNRHTVMSRFTPVLAVIVGSEIKTESKVTLGPMWCVIKNENGAKKSATSAVNC